MSTAPATPAPAPLLSLAAVALNRAADGRAPDWIQLLPAGERLQGRDGREWVNDVAGVAAAFAANAGPLAIDFEHAQDIHMAFHHQVTDHEQHARAVGREVDRSRPQLTIPARTALGGR